MKLLSWLKSSFATFIFFDLCLQSYAAESRFFRLNGAEVLTREGIHREIGEIGAFLQQLGIDWHDLKCHFFLEEVSLAQEDRGSFYWSLPIAEDLSYSYRQPVGVKIFGDGVDIL
jgi:hypothetical protein